MNSRTRLKSRNPGLFEIRDAVDLFSIPPLRMLYDTAHVFFRRAVFQNITFLRTLRLPWIRTVEIQGKAEKRLIAIRDAPRIGARNLLLRQA
jgi:hypothetical protein